MVSSYVDCCLRFRAKIVDVVGNTNQKCLKKSCSIQNIAYSIACSSWSCSGSTLWRWDDGGGGGGGGAAYRKYPTDTNVVIKFNTVQMI